MIERLYCKFLITKFTGDFKLNGSISSSQMNYLKERKKLSKVDKLSLYTVLFWLFLIPPTNALKCLLQ
jgi:hypothetical protein